jgi:hypothetical protein
VSHCLPNADSEENVDTAAIIDGLRHYERLPVATIQAARADRAAVVPEFLRLIEEHLARDGASETEHAALFLIFHLLGEWRETSAYRPLAKLLRRPDIDSTLDDAVTETMHQVMAAVFDGDPQPLYDIILDRGADEFIRSMTFKSVSTLVLDGRLPRTEASRFLAACASDIESDAPTFAWIGWTEAIATLGLAELRPLVERTFAADLIETFHISIEEFDEALAYALAHPDAPGEYWGAKLRPFGDAIAELSDWVAFNEDYPREKFERTDVKAAIASRLAALMSRRDPAQQEGGVDLTYVVEDPTSPFVNPSRSIGRNDPCPCGSGKKYKKCCLN